MNPVKMFVLAAVTFVAGMALGGVGPRLQNRYLQEQISELAERECDSGVSNDLRRLLSGSPMGVPTPPPVPPEPAAVPAPAEVSPPTSMKQTDDALNIEWTVDGEPTTSDHLPNVDELANAGLYDALDLRRVQAQARLRESAWPDATQQEHIDEAYAQMNEDLSQIAGDFITELDTNTQPSRRELMMLAADTLDTMINAEEEVLRTLDDEQFEAVDPEATDPFAHIDPAILDVLEQLPR